MQVCTNLAAAHRFATIRKVDCIIVLGKAKLLDIDIHDALVAQGGMYAKLAALQLGATSA